ncbi:ubiquitin carboxyl-terminal hydrolase 47-like [Haplochromis burtoni]|uniref:ubiquitin carboxyl-terminal hydrolase 47-like n=1 Tax=Haplochromis burtoni TaxID=8153 RepID=UPI001C2CD502|nr:ubiquitin carboxyl-terminal hydrolase 47-like [Haplochromis burtoni]
MISSRKRNLEETKTEEQKKRRQDTDAVIQQQKLHGLKNQGATCYLNSVLQVLLMTPEIHDRLDPESQKIDQGLRNIFERLKKRTCGTKKITKTLEIHNVSQQRDAADCLDLILSKVSPPVSELFEGQLMYTTQCSEGHVINEETNPFWTLPLSLRDNPDETYSVEEGFEKVFQIVSYSGDSMVYCQECEKKTGATSGCEMVKFPRILILLLKRFDFDYNTMSDFKSDCCVAVPSELKTKDKKYKVYGIVNHMGSLRGGHYTATVLSKEDHTWYECDDSHVTQSEEQLFAKTRAYNSRTAYLLMYRALEREPEEVKEQQGSRRRVGKKDEPEERIMDEYIKKSAGKIHKDAPQPGKSSDIKRNCILIALVIVGFAFIVILYKSQVSA